MLPYGIVYRDNPYSLQKSVELWQKKFGIYNLPTFLKLGSISAVILLGVNIAVGLISGQGAGYYIFNFIVMLLMTFVLIYIVANNTYIKQMALANATKDEKQLVLFSDYLEYTTPFSKAVYYYSDLSLIIEGDGLLTVITDTAAVPLSISTAEVKKGDYNKFISLLRQAAPDKFRDKGGRG